MFKAIGGLGAKSLDEAHNEVRREKTRRRGGGAQG